MASGDPLRQELMVDTYRDGPAVVVAARRDPGVADAERLRAVLNTVHSVRSPRVEVDLSDLHGLDAEGLMTLLAAQRRLAAEDVALAIRAPGPPVRRMLAVTGLDRLIEVVD